MSRWRILVVVGLLVTPVVIWAGLGTYYLWQTGWGFWSWWPMFAMFAAGHLLAWHWQRQQKLLRPPEFVVEPHWTDRDKQAWALVEARAKQAPSLPAEKLATVPFYVDTAREMALELASFYHPGATDPLDGVTVPEILAVVELATHDLGVMVEQHLPGGHLLTIKDWKRTKQLTEWFQTGSQVYWAVSAVFNPLQTVARYAASQLGMATPMKMLQQNLFVWFYIAFLQRLGIYLIDLNSGRLRVGATRYRELVDRMKAEAAKTESPMEKMAIGPFPGGATTEKDPLDQVQQVTITVLGQVKAGKSSLINALLGEQRAKTGVVPTTNGIERYELQTPGVPSRLVLNDTVGYALSGPRQDQIYATAEVAKQSDLLFLVLHARNPARQADLDMLEGLKKWFAARPDLRSPPIVAVVTHIDLLSPAMEWNPPYDWLHPKKPKEVNIHDCLAANREQLGDHVVSIVPVCGSVGKVYGVEEALIPVIANLLDELHGVALLRALKAEANKDRIMKVFHQAMTLGKVAITETWQALRGKKKGS